MATAVVGLRAVGGACGAVELGLGSREGAVGSGAGAGDGAVGVGLSRGIDSVCHGCLFWSLENEDKGVCFCSERTNKGKKERGER